MFFFTMNLELGEGDMEGGTKEVGRAIFGNVLQIDSTYLIT